MDSDKVGKMDSNTFLVVDIANDELSVLELLL